MKLVLAIVSDNDSSKVLTELSKHRFSATKLATTGGFLKMGNTTFMIGVDDDKVPEVIEIVKSKSSTRKQYMTPSDVMASAAGPVEITVGGATIFVLDVNQFEKF